MRAGNYDITCEQGTTFVRLLILKRPDLIADPTGNTYVDFDITGYTARMQVRRTIENPTAMLSLTTENNGLTINPTGESNQIRIDIVDSVTASIQNSGVYDLEIISSEGAVSRLIQGNFNLIPEVTR